MPRRPRPANDVAATVEPIRKLKRRMDLVEQPDGNQLSRALEKIQTLIANIGTYVDAYLLGGFTTGSITVTGTSTLGLVNSLATYNRNVTGSGTYRVRYVNILGEEGYVPSSRTVKQDIVDVVLDADAVRAIRTVAFRYILAVENLGDAAPVEIGVIAEEVHDLGLTWLVDYNEDGSPAGVKYERLSLALLCVAQQDDERIRRIEEMLGIGQAQ